MLAYLMSAYIACIAVNRVVAYKMNKNDKMGRLLRNATFSCAMVLLIIIAKELWSDNKKEAVSLSNVWSTAYHLNKYPEKWQYEDKELDLIIINQADLEVYAGIEKVYIPTLGEVRVLEQDEFHLYTAGYSSAYSGLSGTRVLTSDLLMDVGFVSRIEDNRLVVVKTWGK